MKKFVLIGCGAAAVHHARNILRTGQLLAVCDTDREKAEALAEKCGGRIYTEADVLLANENEADTVVICTPNGYHAEHIIKALQARKNVVCESPLCLTTAAAWQMIETEKFCRRKVYVAMPTQYSNAVTALKKQLSQTESSLQSFHLSCSLQTTEPYFDGWRGKHFPGGGLLYTPFSEAVNVLQELFGGIQTVSGSLQRNGEIEGMEIESGGVVNLEMQSGITGSLQWSVNAGQEKQMFSLTIQTNGEALCMQGGQGDNFITTNDGIETNERPDLERFYEQLILQNNHHFLPGLMEGLRTVEAIEKIYKAISST